MAEPSQIDAALDELYAARPAEFVPARDALAKRLRAEGHRAEADRVKALVRPTVAAWAINQLARREPEWTRALANAGRRLEEAQAALLSGGDRSAWRDAVKAQRETIDRLARLAEDVVREERGSVSQGLREQVRETLQAATIDPEAREAVSAGRLTRELRASGLLGAGADPASPERAEPAEPDKAAKRTKPRKAAKPAAAKPAAASDRAARQAAEAAQRDARASLRRAQREATAARNAAERAAKAAARARKAHEAAAAARAEAEQAEQQRARDLAAADEAEQAAATSLREHEAAVAQARDALERAS